MPGSAEVGALEAVTSVEELLRKAWWACAVGGFSGVLGLRGLSLTFVR